METKENNLNKRIGEKFKNIRTKNNLTIQEFAKILNIADGSVYNYENGTRGLPIEVLYILKMRFRIDLNKFVD